MASLYRKSALDKISSPEQLDKALVITSPLSWLALIGMTLIVVAVAVWSILGSIPITVTVRGMIVSPDSTNAVYSFESGTIISVLVHDGSELHFGDVVLTYRDNKNEIKTLYSDQVGTVSAVMVNAGGNMTQGNEVLRLSPVSVGKQVAVCYIPLSDVRKIERGMRVQIYMDSFDSQTYGYLAARVINIDSYATSNSGMEYVLGVDNNLTASFQQAGALVAVTCEFYPDDTANGYYWSNEKGADVDVANGSLISARIITDEVAPITKLFSKLGEIWGK